MNARIPKISLGFLALLSVPLIIFIWLLRIWPSTYGTARARATTVLSPGRPDRLTALSYSPDGKVIAGMSDGRSWFFNADTGKLEASYQSGTGLFLSWSRDGRKLVAASHGLWIRDVAHPEKSFRQPLAMGGPNAKTEYGDESYSFCSISSDASLAGCALTHELNDEPWKDGAIAVWNVKTNQRQFYRGMPPNAAGSKRRVCGLTFSADNQTLAVASLLMGSPRTDKDSSSLNTFSLYPLGAEVSLFDTHSGKELKSFDWPTVEMSLAANAYANENMLGLAFSPDGQFLAGADGEGMRLWKVSNGQVLRDMKARTTKRSIGRRRLLFSPDGRFIAGNWEMHIEMWSVSSGRRQQIFRPQGFCQALAFSPDSQTLASSSGNGQGYLQLWNVGH